MTVDRHPRARRTGSAGAGAAAGAGARSGRDPGQGRGRRRQPPGRARSARASIRRPRALPTFRALRSPAKSWRSAPAQALDKVGDRVMALVAGGGYARILPRPRKPRAAGAAELCRWSRPPPFRRRFFTVWHNVFERGALQGRRNAAGARRHIRHRHHRDPARQGVRRARDRHRRLGGKVPTPAAGSAPTSPSTTRPRISSPRPRQATGGKGANVILDMVGGDYIERNYEAAADRGPHRADRLSRRAEGDGRFRRLMHEAPASHRFDAAAAHRLPTRRRSRAAIEEKVCRCSPPAGSSR